MYFKRQEFQHIEDKVFDLLQKEIKNNSTRASTEEFLDIHQHLTLYKEWLNQIEKKIEEVKLIKIKNKILVSKIFKAYKP
jgi:mevalonate pyrophosphate decarboxylase